MHSDDGLLTSCHYCAAPARRRRTADRVDSETVNAARRRRSVSKEGQKKWDTLEHAGVSFPPEYQAHGIKMLFEGEEINLTPEQEEVRPACAAPLCQDQHSAAHGGQREQAWLDLAPWPAIVTWHHHVCHCQRRRASVLFSQEARCL